MHFTSLENFYNDPTFFDYKILLSETNLLVEKLLVLIENNSLRKKFGNESRKFAVKNFDENLIIKKNIKIYNDLIGHDRST